MTVSECTERELIARIRGQLPPAPGWLLVGIGDDAAVVEPERNRVEVLTVDALVEGVHFERAFVPPQAIGHRAPSQRRSMRMIYLGPLFPVDLPVDVIVVLEQQERADQAKRIERALPQR